MPIQVDSPKPHTGKLFAAGLLMAVLLIAFSMPRMLRALILMMVVLAAISSAWVFF